VPRNVHVVKIQKLYDSLGIRFPKRLVEEWGLRPGEYVGIEWDSEEIVIRRVRLVA